MLSRLLLLGLFCCLNACSGVGPGNPDWALPREEQVWPEPPVRARIQFLRSFQTASDPSEDKRGDKVFKWLTGDAGPEVRVRTPFGVAADGRGRIWLADTESRAIQSFDLARQRAESWTQLGKWSLLSPVDIARDARTGRLYVSDSALRKVFVIDGDPRNVRLLEPADAFKRPTGLAVAADGQVYVADTLAGVVQVFDAQGGFLRSQRSGVTPDGRFSMPGSLAVDKQGRLFVVDGMNFRVEYFSPQGESLGVIGQLGDTPGSLARPRGVALDSGGHVYVSDAAFDNVQVFDLAGNLLLGWGGPGNGPGKFNLPAGMVFDESDRLYVVDAFNHRVQIFQYLGD